MNKLEIILCLTPLLIGSASLAMNSDWGTSLRNAASSGNLNRVVAFLDAGVWVDVKNSYDHTPLMFAVIQGHNEICQLLIDRNAQIDARDTHGRNSLWYAVTHGHEETCELLIDIMIKPIKQSQAAAIALLGMKRFRNVACMNQLDKNIIRLIAHQLIVPAKEKFFEQIDIVKSERPRQCLLKYANQQLKGPKVTKDGYSYERVYAITILVLVLSGLAHFCIF